jgi:hypothetical protein
MKSQSSLDSSKDANEGVNVSEWEECNDSNNY